MTPEYDVIIIGAGPAGLFAASQLIKSKLRVLVIEEGPDIEERHCPMENGEGCRGCSPCHIMSGVGGAGTFSDGTLNLRHDIGGDLTLYTKDLESAKKLVQEVDEIFLRFGAPTEFCDPSGENVQELKRHAGAVGITFIEIKQRHIGSDNAPRVIKAFVNYLKNHGVEFKVWCRVEDIIEENGECRGVVLSNGEKIYSRYVLAAPGRVGASWFDHVVKAHKIKAQFAPIDVGIRIEVPAILMNPIIEIAHDPKFHIQTHTYDDFVRTFCTNHRGFVVKENYDGFVGVNGHSLLSRKSENTNFAFLVQIRLTHPVENTIQYGKSIATLATTIGGGKPILQRLGDLRRGRRSNEEGIKRNPLKPTLHDYTPGDISMALPHRVVVDLLEGLEKLNKIIPGVASDSTLLYAPEIKFYATQVVVNEGMESSIKNLYVAGDGAGLSRDIVNAAATGILAARRILKNES